MKWNEVIKIKNQVAQIELFSSDWTYFLSVVGLADKQRIHKRVLLEQLGKCSHCSQHEWMGKPIPTELEHKDGNHSDDTRGNLEVLCPNCHALTPTWRGRNKGKNQVSDKDLIKALQSEPSIRAALISVGLAGKGGNYTRCHKLLRVCNSIA